MEVQKAIEAIEKESQEGASGNKLTILIIAHRLTSIKDAKNLLMIENRSLIKGFQKGSPEYEEALIKLKNFTYAYGEGQEEEDEQEKVLQRSESMASK